MGEIEGGRDGELFGILGFNDLNEVFLGDLWLVDLLEN